MPISPTDIVFMLSTTSGSAGNTLAQANANLSLGKYLSTTPITSGVLNNLFDSITGDENALSESEYRLIFVVNNNATLTLTAVKVWISPEYLGGANIAISLDTTGVTPKGQAGAQAKQIADENTAPATQTFTTPTTKAAGLSISSLGPGQCQGIWVRRTAGNTIAQSSDGAVLQVEGDTPG